MRGRSSLADMGLWCWHMRRTAGTLCAIVTTIVALNAASTNAAAFPEHSTSGDPIATASEATPPKLTLPREASTRSLSDVGISVDANLRTTPQRYSPRQPLDIRVTGTLDIATSTTTVCHGLELTVMRGALRLGGRLTSPDRSPIIAGETRVEPVDLTFDLPAEDVPTSGSISIDIALQCSPLRDGAWDFPGESSVVATSAIRVASGTVVVSPTWVFPDADGAGKARISARVAKGPATIRVTVDKKTVWTKKVSTPRINLAIPSAKLARSGTYTVLVRADGTTARSTFRVSKGWAPLMSEPAHWERCSTITWAYDDAKAPRGGDKQMFDDLTKTFNLYERLTGLTFVRVKRGAGDIVIDWANLPDRADGWGGASGYAGILSGGSVTLSTTSRWAKTPGDGVEGRVALLRHEVAHALGLGHVLSDRELMFPIHTAGVSPLTPQKGDIAGLRELYAPSACP